MKHTKDSITVTVDLGVAEYKQIVSDFTPMYLEQRHPERNPYYPWSWAISAKLILVLLVPLIFRLKKSKVGVCEFTFSQAGLTRLSKSGSASRRWDEISAVHRLSTAYLVELSAGGAVPIPYRVFNNPQRARFESFAPASPDKAFNTNAGKAGAG